MSNVDGGWFVRVYMRKGKKTARPEEPECGLEVVCSVLRPGREKKAWEAPRGEERERKREKTESYNNEGTFKIINHPSCFCRDYYFYNLFAPKYLLLFQGKKKQDGFSHTYRYIQPPRSSRRHLYHQHTKLRISSK
jgi:hypothetical protein